MTMRRSAAVHLTLALAAAAALPACFGDNAGGASISISAPDELDGEETAEITVDVKAEPNAQVSVAVDSEAGVFSQQSKLVITDGTGAGSFTTSFTVKNAAGTAVILANISGEGAERTSTRKEIPVYEIERIGEVAPIAQTTTETSYLTGYPLVLSAERTLRKLAIVAPVAATALVGFYNNTIADDGDAPKDALFRATVSLSVGTNEIEVPTQTLPAGRYWMVVTYSGSLVTTARGAETIPFGRTIVGYDFSRGLPDTMPAMTLTTTMGKRNFYLVLRK